MTRLIRALAVAVASLLVLAPAFATDDLLRFYGYAYDLKSDRYVYTEVHEQKIVGDKWIGGSIRYFAPDGKVLGSKTLDFSVDPNIPLYDYELPALGYREGITRIGKDDVTLTRTDKGSGTRTTTVPRKGLITADSGFHSFLRSQFDDLLARKTVAFTFIAAGNLDSYKFRARRIDDTMFEGRKAVRLLVEPNSLLRIVAPSLKVTYDPEQRRLLEYRGPSNVINADTGRVYDVRIAYYAKPPAAGPKVLPPLE